MNEEKIIKTIKSKFGSVSKYCIANGFYRNVFKKYALAKIDRLNKDLNPAGLEVLIVHKSNESIKGVLGAIFPEAHINDWLIETIKENL